MSEFFEGLSEIFEIDVDKVGPGLSFDEVDWDSVAIISTIALVDEVFGIFLDGDVLSNCNNIKDIMDLIEKRLEKMSLREKELDIKIRGIVSIVPNQKIENTFFKNHLTPKTINDVTKITGVKTRYWAKENQTTNKLCLEASKSYLTDYQLILIALML